MSDDQYNKRVVFRENDITHANLRVRLHYDGVKQSQFFRGCIDAYLNQDEDFMAFMETLKSEKSSLSKVRNQKSKKLREKGEELKTSLALNPREIENIFDMIEEEHDGL
jgi:hypothetical protein|tara:strand:- start:5302 stop:5628 length:327 start_codon:yes stop_codon:yes gene_type:complete